MKHALMVFKDVTECVHMTLIHIHICTGQEFWYLM